MSNPAEVENRFLSHFAQLIRNRYFFPLSGFAILAVCNLMLVLPYSVFRGDSLHWGSVVATSLRICEGQTPYTDVPIYYGPASFYSFCLIGRLFEFSYLSFGVATYIAYLVAILSCGMIGRRLGLGPWVVGCFFAACMIMHPFPIYPWYDYFAGAALFSGILLMLSSRSEDRNWLMFLAGALIAVSVLYRTSFSILAVTIVVIFMAARLLTLRSSFGMVAGAGAIAFVFLLAMLLNYGLTPWKIVVETFRSYTHISGVFSSFVPFGNLVSPKVLLSIPGIFVWCAYLAAIHLIVDAFDKSLDRDIWWCRAGLLIVGVIGIGLQHLQEVFRFICCAAPVLLLGLNAIVKAISDLSVMTRSDCNRSNGRRMGHLAIVIVSFGLMKPIYDVSRTYPYASSYFKLRDGETALSALFDVKSETINGISFYNDDQIEQYKLIYEACAAGARVANVTSDVMITGVCRQNAFSRHDSLQENQARQLDLDPETHARLSSGRLEPGELGFYYEPQIKDYPVTCDHILPNARAEWSAFPIAICRPK